MISVADIYSRQSLHSIQSALMMQSVIWCKTKMLPLLLNWLLLLNVNSCLLENRKLLFCS